MALDYFLLAFTASIGVCQIASIRAGLKGLWFFKYPKIQYIFGLHVIIGAFVWFFTDEERNVQHTVEGSQQLVLFLGAIIVAYVVTAMISSLIQIKVGIQSQRVNPSNKKQYEQGMETLKSTTLLGGIAASLRKKPGGKH